METWLWHLPPEWVLARDAQSLPPLPAAIEELCRMCSLTSPNESLPAVGAAAISTTSSAALRVSPRVSCVCSRVPLLPCLPRGRCRCCCVG